MKAREHWKCSPHMEQYLQIVGGTECVTQAQDAAGVSLQVRNVLPSAEAEANPKEQCPH